MDTLFELRQVFINLSTGVQVKNGLFEKIKNGAIFFISHGIFSRFIILFLPKKNLGSFIYSFLFFFLFLCFPFFLSSSLLQFSSQCSKVGRNINIKVNKGKNEKKEEGRKKKKWRRSEWLYCLASSDPAASLQCPLAFLRRNMEKLLLLYVYTYIDFCCSRKIKVMPLWNLFHKL